MEKSIAAKLLERHNETQKSVKSKNFLKLIEEYDNIEEIKALYAKHMGYSSPEEAEGAFEENFQGIYNSEEDYASDFVHDSYFGEIRNQRLRKFFEMYFDYEAFTRDFFINDMDSINLPDGRVAVFSTH